MSVLRHCARRAFARSLRGSPATPSAPKQQLPPQNLIVPGKIEVLPHRSATHTLHSDASIAALLQHPSLVISRKVELLNITLGFEQKHQYGIYSPDGQIQAYLVEHDNGMAGVVARQALRTHRPFTASVLDLQGAPLLTIHRPFYFLNSTITCADVAHKKSIGEVHQSWHLWQRNYDLFLDKQQFGHVNGGFLAQEFEVRDESGAQIARVDRNFTGFAREIFTDARQYVVHFDPEPGRPPLTFDQRAVSLALAVSIDFDYFSLHSGGPGLFSLLLFVD